MKKYLIALTFAFCACFALSAWSQATDVPAPDSQNLLTFAWKAWGVIRQAQTEKPLVAAYLVTQLLMQALGTSLAGKLGAVRMAVAAGLSIVLGALSAHIAGAPWLDALTSASQLALVSNFIHQVVKQGTEVAKIAKDSGAEPEQTAQPSNPAPLPLEATKPAGSVGNPRVDI